MDLYILYYLFLLLLFGHFMLFHFQRVTSTPSSSTLDPASINELVDEIDIDSFYHHPSWPKRWSHPDFTGDYQKKWIASGLDQIKRRTASFLFGLCGIQISVGLHHISNCVHTRVGRAMAYCYGETRSDYEPLD